MTDDREDVSPLTSDYWALQSPVQCTAGLWVIQRSNSCLTELDQVLLLIILLRITIDTRTLESDIIIISTDNCGVCLCFMLIFIKKNVYHHFIIYLKITYVKCTMKNAGILVKYKSHTVNTE